MTYRAQKQARRQFLRGTGAAFSALLLAGCVTAPRGAPPPPPPPVGQPGPIGQPVEPDAPVVKNKVAIIVPTSGNNGGVGRSIANAAVMALADADDDRLELTIYDSGRAGGATAAVNEALGQGAGLILGPLLAENVRAVAPIARDAGVPVIAFSNDESVAGDGVYILGFTPAQSVARSVDYLSANGATDFSAMVPTGTYGKRAADAFLAAVRGVDGRVAAVAPFERRRGAIGTAANRINSAGPVDALLVADNGDIAAMVAGELRINTQLVGTELWAAQSDIVSNAALHGAIFSAVPDARFEQLTTRYRARFNANPYRLASLGYDAGLLAVRASESWRPGASFPTLILKDRGGFGGVDGIFRFDDDGIAERALEVRQITPGGVVVISPAARAF